MNKDYDFLLITMKEWFFIGDNIYSPKLFEVW